MKRLIFLLLVSSLTINAQKKSTDISKNIEETTKIYKELFLSKKFQELSNFASPKLIQHLSTKQDLIYLMTELNKNIESQGATLSNITFGDNSKIVSYDKELQCSIPFILEIDTSEKNIYFNSGLALISFDNGKTWLFTFKVDNDNIKNNQILGLNENIIIPERTQKVIIK
ncbi:hypothetical protein DBR27_18470 [Flavobacterium sp. HMWF030]|nr:hypothetical protein DBR27_18470 [Flavobacterium sp. HMWF030]